MGAEVVGITGTTTATSDGSKIDRTVPIPYYYQLERLLRAEIDGGRWAPNEAILSERQLCETYGVSRTTVRQAISRLVRDGMLYHVKGKGTYVSKRRP